MPHWKGDRQEGEAIAHGLQVGGAVGGLDFEERRGRWRSAVRLPASLVVWPVASEGTPAEAGGCG